MPTWENNLFMLLIINLLLKAKYTNKKVSLTYNDIIIQVIGYTSNDNLNYLPTIRKTFSFSYRIFSKKNLNNFYKINNLYNNNYQLIINRPMPMINHELGFNFKINK